MPVLMVEIKVLLDEVDTILDDIAFDENSETVVAELNDVVDGLIGVGLVLLVI